MVWRTSKRYRDPTATNRAPLPSQHRIRAAIPREITTSVANLKFLAVSLRVHLRNFKFKAAPASKWAPELLLIRKFASVVRRHHASFGIGAVVNNIGPTLATVWRIATAYIALAPINSTSISGSRSAGETG